jgi:hypothetical protein
MLGIRSDFLKAGLSGVCVSFCVGETLELKKKNRKKFPEDGNKQQIVQGREERTGNQADRQAGSGKE